MTSPFPSLRLKFIFIACLFFLFMAGAIGSWMTPRSPREKEIIGILQRPKIYLTEEYERKLSGELSDLRGGRITWAVVAGLRLAVLATIVWLIASAGPQHGFAISLMIGFLATFYPPQMAQGLGLFLDSVVEGFAGMVVALVVWYVADSEV